MQDHWGRVPAGDAHLTQPIPEHSKYGAASPSMPERNLAGYPESPKTQNPQIDYDVSTDFRSSDGLGMGLLRVFLEDFRPLVSTGPGRPRTA